MVVQLIKKSPASGRTWQFNTVTTSFEHFRIPHYHLHHHHHHHHQPPPTPFFRSNSSNMYGYVSQVVSTLQNFQPKPCVYFSFLSFILHSLWLDCPHKIFWIQKITMFPLCNFYSFLFLPPFWFRCKCSPCLPVPEFSKHKFLPLEWKTDFQTYKNQNCIKFVITQYYYHHHHHYHRHHRFSWQMIT